MDRRRSDVHAKGKTPAVKRAVTTMKTLHVMPEAQTVSMMSNAQQTQLVATRLKAKKVHEVGRRLASLHTSEGS